MRCVTSLVLLACALTVSWADVVTPEPMTVAPVTVNMQRPLPGIANLLGTLGISDPQGWIRRVFKFLIDPNMRNESASAYNGIRQAGIDAFSCFGQKLSSELKDQEGIVTKIVDAMHKVTVPASDPTQNSTADVVEALRPELDILRQIWNNEDFQAAYFELRTKVTTSLNAGMTCLRDRLKTIRGDVEWILGNVLHTFKATTPSPSATTAA